MDVVVNFTISIYACEQLIKFRTLPCNTLCEKESKDCGYVNSVEETLDGFLGI